MAQPRGVVARVSTGVKLRLGNRSFAPDIASRRQPTACHILLNGPKENVREFECAFIRLNVD